ncbi:Uncharacterised protein [Vibrio cholerae]|nr:Uncharacterised protein [Vibrio cholerae]
MAFTIVGEMDIVDLNIDFSQLSKGIDFADGSVLFF